MSLVGKRVGAKDHMSLAAKLQVSHFHCTHHNILMTLVGKRVGAKDHRSLAAKVHHNILMSLVGKRVGAKDHTGLWQPNSSYRTSTAHITTT
jgi:hypothetical protein